MLQIYFYNSAAGQNKNGVQYGPDKISEELINRGYKLEIIKSISEKGPRIDLNYNEIENDCKIMHKAILENSSSRQIFLGGDHSMAIATISAMLQKYNDLFVVWIDAHADINTSASSKSGNIHGMPLSQITGIETIKRFDWIKKHLSPDNLLYIGIRDLDQFEIDLIKEKNIKFITVNDIKQKGINAIITEIKNIINHKPLHISIDVDGIDPKYIPSTGTKFGDGLDINDMYILFKSLNDINLKSFDIVELNPLLGTKEDVDQSIMNVVNLIEKLI